MRRSIQTTSAAVMLSLAALASTAGVADAGDVMIMKAFARASATPTARAGAAYVSVMNHASQADRLLSAASPAARSAEIHKSEVVDGVMKMAPVAPLEIAANATLEMKPGGYHIMLMGLAAPLKEGSEIEITLTFEHAGDVQIMVPVGGVADGGHDHGAEGSAGSGG